MTRLSFKFQFKTREMNDLDLPVEVREPDFMLVARALSSEQVSVGPGRYYVVARMPAGQKFYANVEVKKGADEAPVVLAPAAGEESPTGWDEVFHFLGSSAEKARPTAPLKKVGPGVKLWLFHGNAFTKATLVRDMYVPEPELNAPVELFGDESPQLLRVERPGAPPLTIAVPASPGLGCRVILSHTDEGGLSADMHMENTQADLLLHYVQSGLLTEAAITTKSSVLTAERLLYDKKQDPVAGAVGAYALLRLDEQERLDEWTENLCSHNTWLPDGMTIRAEYLARLGKHQAAAELFLSLPKYGLPIFSDGLSYTVDRLRGYASAEPEWIVRKTLAEMNKLLRRLQPLAANMNFGEPVLMIPHLDVPSVASRTLREAPAKTTARPEEPTVRPVLDVATPPRSGKGRVYEVVFIVDPSTHEEDLTRLIDGLKGIVTDQGGTVTKSEVMGRRQLAYRIGRSNEGIYVLFEVEGTGKEIAELERRMRVSDQVMRYLTVRVDEERRRAEKLKSRRARKSSSKPFARAVGQKGAAALAAGDSDREPQEA